MFGELFTILVMIAISIGILYAAAWVARPVSTTRSVLKTLPVALLAAAVFTKGDAPLLVVALALSAMGDLFLSREGKNHFLAGLGSFLLAHVAYIVLFLQNPGLEMPGLAGILSVTFLSGLLVMLALANLWKHLGEMRIPVIIYTLIIATMNIAAWATGQPLLLLAGVTLFVISDLVLAHELFFWQNPIVKNLAAHVVWLTYLCAQILIVTAF